jgi:hypothetical protein
MLIADYQLSAMGEDVFWFNIRVSQQPVDIGRDAMQCVQPLYKTRWETEKTGKNCFV